MVRVRSVILSLSLLGVLVLPSLTFAAACPYTWTTTLKPGDRGTEVAKLQEFLSLSPRSGWYGPVTRQAVTNFQEKYTAEILTPNNLTHGTGVVGGATRAKLNQLCSSEFRVQSSESNPQLSTQNSQLTVAVGDQPRHTLAPSFALYVPFTKLTLTAGDKDVTVTKVMVRRVGPASDQPFADIGILDGDGSEYTFGYLHADHTVTLTDPLTIPAHTAVTITVVGDMGDVTDHDGEMPGLQVDSIVADAPVTGVTLPVVGTLQTTNAQLSIGTATTDLSGEDPNGARTQYVNDTNVKIAGVRVSAGSQEDLRLNSITWEQTGSASPNDISNVRTVINGTAYPAEADGRYYTSTIPGGIIIHKGNAVDAVAVADIGTTGAGRTVEFDLYYSSDINLTGMTYGFGVDLSPEGHTGTTGTHSAFITSDGTTDGDALTPYFLGSVITISPGAFTNVGK